MQPLVGSGGDENRTCGSPLATWIWTTHTYWVPCEQFKSGSKCYNKHTIQTHTHPCVVFIFVLTQPSRKKKESFWNLKLFSISSPCAPLDQARSRAAAAAAAVGEHGPLLSQPEPFGYILSPFSQRTRQHRGLVVLRSMWTHCWLLCGEQCDSLL